MGSARKRHLDPVYDRPRRPFSRRNARRWAIQLAPMRLRSLAPVLVAAVLGAGAALGVAAATGRLGTTPNATYVIKEQAPAAPAAVKSVVKPLITGFEPARIYAARSPGVVTVFAFFGSPHTPLASQS